MRPINNCIYCDSTRVVKHGKTPKGQVRFRCRNCGKTWVSDKKPVTRPEMSKIAASYLDGVTYRELVEIYHSSPQRINQKIREFLEGCPRWEDYLDAYINEHTPKMVYLVSLPFSCQCKQNNGNTMYAGFAIDALSTVILGFETGTENNFELWDKLISNLKRREIKSSTFMTNGIRPIEEAVLKYYPKAEMKINYHRAYRDREIKCCLKRDFLNDKIVRDAAQIFKNLNNKNIRSYINLMKGETIQDFLDRNQLDFINRLKYRLDNKSTLRIEGLIKKFVQRFEKFHMLKDDPTPLINGLIARKMLKETDMGFSRLSLYAQVPSITDFSDFACATMPKDLDLKLTGETFKVFLIELAARSVELPVIISRCDLRSERCCLL